MKFVSLFAGVGGFDLALERTGHTCVGQCEIEPVAMSVLARHWPAVPKHDDVSTITASTFDHPDIVTFGSPCQDLSVAGNRAGMSEGTRSGLFLEAVRYIREVWEASGGQQPRFALWENVPGAYSSNDGRDFATVLALLVGGDVRRPASGWANAGVAFGPLGSAEWRTLDSRYFGVAQRRRRVFLVYRPGGECAGEVLLEPDGVRGDPAASGEAGQGTAGGVEPRASGDGWIADTLNVGANQATWFVGDAVVAPSVLASWGHHGYSSPRGDGADPIVPVPIGLDPQLNAHENAAGALNTGSATGGGQPSRVAVPIAFALRGRDDGAVPEVHEEGRTVGTLRGAEGGSSRDYVAFDLAQITSAANRTRAETGLPASTLAANSDMHVAFAQNQRDEVRDLGDLAGDLAAEPDMKQQTYLASAYAVRRLTPRECERLQGFPDDWTRYRPDGTELADTHRYRLMGNAVTVNVVEWIGRRLPA